MGGVGREGAASGEGGSGLGGLENGDLFLSFLKKKQNTNLSFNGSKNKQKKENVKQTKQNIKNPLTKDFFP